MLVLNGANNILDNPVQILGIEIAAGYALLDQNIELCTC